MIRVLRPDVALLEVLGRRELLARRAAPLVHRLRFRCFLETLRLNGERIFLLHVRRPAYLTDCPTISTKMSQSFKRNALEFPEMLLNSLNGDARALSLSLPPGVKEAALRGHEGPAIPRRLATRRLAPGPQARHRPRRPLRREPILPLGAQLINWLGRLSTTQKKQQKKS